MDLRLTGRLALVTGSTGGIGKGVAKALAREGAAVIVHGRNEARACRVAEEIGGEGAEAFVATGDLSTDAGAELVAQKVLSISGGVASVQRRLLREPPLDRCYAAGMGLGVPTERALRGAHDRAPRTAHEAARLGTGTTLWALSLLVPEPWRFVMWGLALLIEGATPWFDPAEVAPDGRAGTSEKMSSDKEDFDG